MNNFKLLKKWKIVVIFIIIYHFAADEEANTDFLISIGFLK